jgi:hypothetical protein
MFEEPIYWQVDPQSIIEENNISSQMLAAFRLYCDRRLLGTRLTKNSNLLPKQTSDDKKLFDCFKW